MKNLTYLSAAVLAVVVGLPAANAFNVVNLQNYMNSITTAPSAGQSSIDYATEMLADGSDAHWQIDAVGLQGTTVVLELAGAAAVNKYGIYDPANPNNKIQLFSGSASTGTKTALAINASGKVTVIEDVEGTPTIRTGQLTSGNCFGYYLDSADYPGGGLFYSDTALNQDNFDHMFAYRGKGDTIQIAGNVQGQFTSANYLMSWEDLFGGGDADMDDFAVLVESVTPCPDSGGTLALLGAGMLGLAIMRRKLS